MTLYKLFEWDILIEICFSKYEEKFSNEICHFKKMNKEIGSWEISIWENEHARLSISKVIWK